MSTRRDMCGEALVARLASSLVLVLLGLIAAGCDKVQLPQMGQQPAATPAATPGNATAATGTPAGMGQPPVAAPAVDAKPDPKAILDEFLKKAATLGQINDADLIRVSSFPESAGQIQELNLAGSPITDVGAATLSKFPKLSRVELGGTPVTNVGIEVVKDMPELRVLGLGHTKIDDRALASIGANAGIKELKLNNTTISDFGLNELEKLNDLEVLDVSGTPINGSGFEKFRGHKHLRVLHAQHTSLQNEALKFLVNCPIQELNLDVTPISDVGMIHIGKMNEMRKLSLEFCGVTDFGVHKMGVMKDLEYISVRNNGGISNLLFAKIQRCKKLQTVNAIGTRINGNDVAKLMKLLPGIHVML